MKYNIFYIMRIYRYTLHEQRRKIGLDTLGKVSLKLGKVSLKQAYQCATQWRSVYHVSNGVSS
ncbi:hypothetical protein [Bartonella sp. MR110HLJHH]|uniref:hypothetical protein n=1 Tax=Bartonella sp. MR110HLJHH TaxID=3243555 RepID=UPI0035D0B58A